VGVFTGTVLNEAMPTAMFMKISFEQKEYMGFLSVNDAVLCLQLDKLLNQYIGRPIEQIGDLDVSFLLYVTTTNARGASGSNTVQTAWLSARRRFFASHIAASFLAVSDRAN